MTITKTIVVFPDASTITILLSKHVFLPFIAKSNIKEIVTKTLLNFILLKVNHIDLAFQAAITTAYRAKKTPHNFLICCLLTLKPTEVNI